VLKPLASPAACKNALVRRRSWILCFRTRWNRDLSPFRADIAVSSCAVCASLTSTNHDFAAPFLGPGKFTSLFWWFRAPYRGTGFSQSRRRRETSLRCVFEVKVNW